MIGPEDADWHEELKIQNKLLVFKTKSGRGTKTYTTGDKTQGGTRMYKKMQGGPDVA